MIGQRTVIGVVHRVGRHRLVPQSPMVRCDRCGYTTTRAHMERALAECTLEARGHLPWAQCEPMETQIRCPECGSVESFQEVDDER